MVEGGSCTAPVNTLRLEKQQEAKETRTLPIRQSWVKQFRDICAKTKLKG